MRLKYSIIWFHADLWSIFCICLKFLFLTLRKKRSFESLDLRESIPAQKLRSETLQLDNTLLLKRLFWGDFSQRAAGERADPSDAPRSDPGSAARGEVKTVFLKGFLICRPETMSSRFPHRDLSPPPPRPPDPSTRLPSGSQGLTDAAVRAGESWGAFAAKPVHPVDTEAAVVAAEKERERETKTWIHMWKQKLL